MKFWKSLAIALLVLLILATVAAAQALWVRELPVTVEIVKGSEYLGIYDSDNYTYDSTGWKLVNLKRGDWFTRTWYLRNDGNEPLVISPRTEPEVLSWCNFTFEPSGNQTLLRNQKSSVNVTVWAHPDAPTGNYTFKLRF